jgi:hypothetical protein
MNDRTKLTLASLTVMMLPYQIDFSVTVLVVTAILSTVIVVVSEMWDLIQLSGKFPGALSLYRRLQSRPLFVKLSIRLEIKTSTPHQHDVSTAPV